MIKVSKLADYAVVILATMARNDQRMTASGLSAQTGLPEPTVAKVLKLLAREDILKSERGANGGYQLAKPLAEITVANLVSIVDGPIALTACVDGAPGTCSYASRCAVKGRWNGVNQAIMGAMENVSLADMVST